jgi:hypothetical protein
VETEGDGFLSITLPTFAKALERALATGQWSHHGNFKRCRGLPAFLRGFLMRIFSVDGALLDEPDANCIWAVRQICNLTGKVDALTTPSRERAARSAFIKTDSELAEHFDMNESSMPYDHFDEVALRLFGDLFDHCEKQIAAFELIPSHGPGAVADKLSHPQRWQFEYWTDRLEDVFPSWRYAQNLPTMRVRDTVPTSDELPVRVVSVPKTRAKPRIIAIEPSTMQYAQQGLKREIYDYVRRSPLSGILGFTDQTRNQQLALEASITGSLATLDLSEASDRVHKNLVSRLLRRWPHLHDFVMATRSLRADVDGEVIHLAKYASMGSALTFPLEAIIFTVIAFMGVDVAESRRTTVRQAAGRISVYGDDIIVPVDSTADVVRLIEAFGFKVNEHKSFWTGMFRESCGKEYYRGSDVSVVRLRAEVPTSRQDAVLIRRFTEFRNRAYRAGYWRTVKVADDLLSLVVRMEARHVDELTAIPSSEVAKDTVLQTPFRHRWNIHLHRWERRALFVVPQKQPYAVDGDGGVLKWFFEAESDEDDSGFILDSFESQERPRSFRTKRAWIESLPKHSMVALGDLRGPLK